MSVSGQSPSSSLVSFKGRTAGTLGLLCGVLQQVAHGDSQKGASETDLMLIKVLR